MVKITKNTGETYSLGSLPWSDEAIEKAVWKDFIKAQILVDEHPGCDLYERLVSLNSILKIFEATANKYFERLNQFEKEVEDGSIFYRSRKSELAEYESDIQQCIYIFSASAMTLVDQSRAFSNKVTIPEYANKVDAIFADNPRHRFIQELRNDLIHVSLHQPNWQITTNMKNESTTKFVLGIDQLSCSKKYNKLAREYIEAHPGGIDLGDLITQYSNDVMCFHHWLNESINLVAGDMIEDYQRCSNKVKSVSSKSLWNIKFKHLIENKKDPYQYLDMYLTENELLEIQSLSHKSKDQVDKIIDMVDEYNACDENLREIIYKAFGILETS